MSGGSNKAAKQAQRNEDERKAQIAAATGQINSIFDNPQRTDAYGKLAADTTSFYTQQLDDQKAINDRKLKFALARNGQVGGSVQTDFGARAGKDYLKGVLEAQRRGSAAGAGLRQQDEQARANLIAAAQGGLDATSAASQAAIALRSNLEAGKASATADAFGDAFGDFSDIYQRSRDAKALRDGYNSGLGGWYQPGFGTGGGGR